MIYTIGFISGALSVLLIAYLSNLIVKANERRKEDEEFLKIIKQYDNGE